METFIFKNIMKSRYRTVENYIVCEFQCLTLDIFYTCFYATFACYAEYFEILFVTLQCMIIALRIFIKICNIDRGC